MTSLRVLDMILWKVLGVVTEVGPTKFGLIICFWSFLSGRHEIINNENGDLILSPD